MDENTLLTGERNTLYIRKDGKNRQTLLSLDGEEFSFGGFCISDANFWFATSRVERYVGGGVSSTLSRKLRLPVVSWENGVPQFDHPVEHEWLDEPALPDCTVDLKANETNAFLRGSQTYQEKRSIDIGGNLIKLEHATGNYARLFPGNLFLDRNPAGLIHLTGQQATRYVFPESYISQLEIGRRLGWGELLWDSGLNQALFVHNTCGPGQSGPDCRRKALWLTASLEPISDFEMPGESLLEIKNGYTCFSCGCGCNSHEELYVMGGEVFLHVWGYPVKNLTRGVYRLKQKSTGPAWEKIISGRPQSPIAVSPNGRQIAYFELSRLGDQFRIVQID
ncbi:hypothetical protein [Pseudophaeobacter sp. EL27]|uniref:hypothetical protein n=1 Tax=Pseudophaeobacter sp. EL27 TaxID=2107580 RepID=UPI000EFC4A27|nr:hypothetical protein [Pseudophaeobacter sp. EL27]